MVDEYFMLYHRECDYTRNINNIDNYFWLLRYELNFFSRSSFMYFLSTI